MSEILGSNVLSLLSPHTLIFCYFAFQFVIKPVGKKVPDFIFYAPKVKINKLVSNIHNAMKPQY